MRVVGYVAYAMMLDEKRNKLDAKGTKYWFVSYCKGTKAYSLMCLQTKKIIKNRDVVFMNDNTSVKNDMEIYQSGKNEGLRWSLRRNLLNRICVIIVGSERSKSEITWLQLKKQSKYMRIMTAMSRDLAKMEDILRRNGIHMESAGRITFFSNATKSKLMWHFLMILLICAKH